MASYGSKILKWFDDRYGTKDDWSRQVDQIVPAHATKWYYCLGGLTFMMICIQVISGVLLMFYYKPSVKEAYDSVRFISTIVPFGWLVRSVHHWGASLTVIFVLLHMLRIWFTGQYKNPRELSWVSGVFLLVIVFAFSFTGYLLPWDQIAYWATTVGSEITGAVPPAPLGHAILMLLRGGETVSGETLTRFFAIHVAVLPLMVMLFMGAHFAMIRRQGIGGGY